MLFIMLFIGWCCIWGVATQNIGKSKGHENCFWWGFLLGLIGLIIVACLKDNTTNNSNADNVEALDKLQKLKENGVITEQEFQEKKKNLLSKI